MVEFYSIRTLSEAISEVDKLSEEDRAGLATHLLAQMRSAPLGPDDVELARREAEIDAGDAEFLTLDELRRAVGR